VLSSPKRTGSFLSGNLNGLPGDTYRILRATSPFSTWLTVTNITVGPDGTAQFKDPLSSGSVVYRAVGL